MTKIFMLLVTTLFATCTMDAMSRNRSISYDEYCSLSHKYSQTILDQGKCNT